MMKKFCKSGFTFALLVTSSLAMADCKGVNDLAVSNPDTLTICEPSINVIFGYSTKYKAPVWGAYTMKSSMAAKKPVYLSNTGSFSPIKDVPISQQLSAKQIINSGNAKAFLVPHYNVIDHPSQVTKYLTMANVFPVSNAHWKGRLSDIMFELGANERKMALKRGDFSVVSGVVYDDELFNEVPSAKYVYKAYYHAKYDYTLSYLIPVKAKSSNLADYLTSINCIEEASGHDLFSGLEDSIKKSIGNGTAFSAKHWVSPNHKEQTCLLKS